jgi:hypothetical protein
MDRIVSAAAIKRLATVRADLEKKKHLLGRTFCMREEDNKQIELRCKRRTSVAVPSSSLA